MTVCSRSVSSVRTVARSKEELSYRGESAAHVKSSSLPLVAEMGYGKLCIRACALQLYMHVRVLQLRAKRLVLLDGMTKGLLPVHHVL